MWGYDNHYYALIRRIVIIATKTPLLGGVVVLLLGFAASAQAQPAFFEFTKLLESGAPAGPQNPLVFDTFNPPSIDGLDLAFRTGPPETPGATARSGIYKGTIRNVFHVEVIADTSTRVGSDNFEPFIEAFKEPSIDGGHILFNGTLDGRVGIWPSSFFTSTGPVVVSNVIDSTDTLPTSVIGETFQFTGFDRPSVSFGRKIVGGSNPSAQPQDAAIYRAQGAKRFLVLADNALDPIDGREFFNVGQGAAGGPSMVFVSNDSIGGTERLHHRRLGSTLEDSQEIARTGVVIETIQNPAVDDEQVVFFGRSGIYKVERDRTGVGVVADTNTPIPGGIGNFTRFGIQPAIDDGNIVFQGRGPNGQEGIYLAHADGTLRKIINNTDLLDGQAVSTVRVGPESISDDRIAFAATTLKQVSPGIFDFAHGLYLATFDNGGLSLTGVAQNNPLLPSAVVAPGVFQFTNAPTGVWFDPPFVSEYRYQMDDGALFTAILEFPSGFDDPFEVVVDGEVVGQFEAGESFSFVDILGEAVSEFAVRNIAPAVDAEDPLAFPLRLAFDREFASFTMVSGPPIPEPSAVVLAATALAALLMLTSFFRFRRTRQAPPVWTAFAR